MKTQLIPYVKDVLAEAYAETATCMLMLATSAYPGSTRGCRQYREDYGVAVENAARPGKVACTWNKMSESIL